MKIFFLNLNKWTIILIGVLLLLILLMTLGLVLNEENAINNPNTNYESTTSIIKTFFTIVIIVPILETSVFQMFIYWATDKLLPRKNYFLSLYLVSSSLLFGISHCFSVLYVFYATLCGAIFAYFYHIFKEKKRECICNDYTNACHL